LQLEKQQGNGVSNIDTHTITPPQEGSSVEMQTFTPSLEGTNTNNEDESSGEHSEAGNTATTSPMILTEFQSWLEAPRTQQFPTTTCGIFELGSFDNLMQDSNFPTLDHYQQPPQLAIEAGFHMTPLMHNDL
jgi:hypothetical protein